MVFVIPILNVTYIAFANKQVLSESFNFVKSLMYYALNIMFVGISLIEQFFPIFVTRWSNINKGVCFVTTCEIQKEFT